MNKNYLVLNAVGCPIARESDEANPYLFNTLRHAYQFAEEEIKNKDAISVVEIKIIERFGSGM